MNAFQIGAALTALLLLVVVGVLFAVYDRQKARFISLQTVMRLYMRKALHDRNDKVRIPATQVNEMFEIDDVRAVPTFRLGRKSVGHPARLGAARRKKL